MSSRRIRYAAPVVVTGLIAAGAWLPTLRASASPDLPAISAQHLVEKVLGQKVEHLFGSFEWSADLGLPSLSGVTGGSGQDPSSSGAFDPTSLLSGTHTFEVWVDGRAEQRIAAPGTLSETDLVHRGDQAWVYDSSTNHVTHYVTRPVGANARSQRSLASGRAYSSRLSITGGPDVGTSAAPTPTSVADQLLTGVRSIGSVISVSRPTDVAGRSAYVLRVAPDRSIAANRVSTVSSATIAVDSRTGLPLRVTVYAVGQSAPAIQVGFTSISFSTPSASEFDAPVGQSTSTKVIDPSASRTSTATTSTAAVPFNPGAPDDAPGTLPVELNGKVLENGGLSTGELNAAYGQARRVEAARAAVRSADAEAASARQQAGAGTVGGSADVNARWAEGPVTLGDEGGYSSVPSATSRTFTVPPSAGAGEARPAGPAHNWGAVDTLRNTRLGSPADQHELDSLTTAVSGRWGSGRLLSSTLVNALILPDGTVLVGAVTPAALEGDAAHTSR